MIISSGRRYIFVHIPKTGGTALALALEARAMADDLLIGDTPKAKKRRHRLKGVKTAGRLWKHSTLADAAGLISPEQMREFYVFTLVRNPWDRLVSYYHWLRDQRFDHPAIALSQALDFSEFLNHEMTKTALSANTYGSYCRDAAGTGHCDLFIRLEHLAEDLAPLEARLGFSLDMPHFNRSTRQKDWRGYYSPEDATLIEKLCHVDIQGFSYGFDDFQP